MTRNSYLKHEIRTRMELTGESYSAASRAIARGEELPEKSAEFPQRPFTPPTDERRSSALQGNLIPATTSGRFEKIEYLKALIIFLERADALTETGLTTGDVISVLASKTENIRLQNALLAVLEEAKPDRRTFSGIDEMSLRRAFESRPDEFPGIFALMLTSGIRGMKSLASVYRTELELL